MRSATATALLLACACASEPNAVHAPPREARHVVPPDAADERVRYTLDLHSPFPEEGLPDVRVDGVLCRLVDVDGTLIVVEPRHGGILPEPPAAVWWSVAPPSYDFLAPQGPPRRRAVSDVPPFVHASHDRRAGGEARVVDVQRVPR